MKRTKPDGYMPDGTPVYLKAGRNSGKSSLQLAIYDALCSGMDEIHYDGVRRFWTGGTGISDEIAIKYWKDTDVIVVTRDGKEWLRGEPYIEQT